MRVYKPRATKSSQITIDGDWDLGPYNLIVDGQNFSTHIANLKTLIKQVHPTLQVFGVIDQATYVFIEKVGNNYLIFTGDSYDVYDEHNDNVINTDLWTITTQSDGAATEEGSAYLYLYVSRSRDEPTEEASVSSDENHERWYGKIKASVATNLSDPTNLVQLILIGSATHTYNLPEDNTYYAYEIQKEDGNLVIRKNGALVLSEADANTTFQIKYKSYSAGGTGIPANYATCKVYVDKTGKTGTAYSVGSLNANVRTDAVASDSAVLSFFKHLKGKYSNGESAHATPVQAEIYGDADAYAAALNGTTKFTIDPGDPRLEFYRDDVSEVAKGALQTTWKMDDNVTNGALPSKTGVTHSTILAEEIGVATIISVKKSILGDFTDTVVLTEEDDYVVDYSTRTATQIILANGTGITTSSKLRIRWIADVIDIDAGTHVAALKLKLYLNRTNTGEASPEIQPLDIGTSKYAEMQYGT